MEGTKILNFIKESYIKGNKECNLTAEEITHLLFLAGFGRDVNDIDKDLKFTDRIFYKDMEVIFYKKP